jgi:PAS domain S-box-containing protein
MISKILVKIVSIVSFIVFGPTIFAQSVELTDQESKYLKENPIVTVANEMDWPPFDYVDDNKPIGYSIELMELVAEKSGFSIEFVNQMTWAELLNAFKKGAIDVLPAVYEDEERKEFMFFTKSYFNQPTIIASNSSLEINNIYDLNGKKVAVIKGFSISKELVQSYPDIIAIEVDNALEGLKKVSIGEVDAMLESIGVISYLLNDNYLPNVNINTSVDLPKMDSPALHMGVRKTDPILFNIIQKGLDAVSREELNDIRNRWFPLLAEKSKTQSGLQLSNEEKVWISTHPVLNVGNERYWPPLDFVDNGKALGYSIDLMELIANELGLKLNYISGLSWSELLEEFNKGTIDVMPAISKTNERTEFIKFSKPYINLPYVKVFNTKTPQNVDLNIENSKIAVIKGSNIEKATLSKYPNIQVIHIKTILNGLEKVSTGEADVFIENLAVVNYYLGKSYIPNVKVTTENLEYLGVSDVYIGVLKKNEILGNLIDKGLKAVSEEDINSLRAKWLPSEETHESTNSSSDLWKILIAVAALFMLFYFSFKWVFKNVINEQIALEFGTRKFRIKANFYLSLLVMIIASIGWLSITYIDDEFSKNIELQLENDLKSANGRIDFWLNQKKEYLEAFGQNQIIVDLAKDLIEVSNDPNKINYTRVQNKLQQFYKEYNNQGSYIINEAGINIGSKDSSLIGNMNRIASNNSDLIGQAFKGEVIFVPALISKEDNLGKTATLDVSSMYFVIPIMDEEHQIIASIIQEINPELGFSEILQLSHVGETGESYVFNQKGRMLSKSRFENDLMNLGVYQFDSKGLPYIDIKDPGGDLTTGFNAVIPFNKRSLTLMAKSAIEGNSGVAIDGYNDYRGVPVLGAWTWIDKLELGLATEIDKEEALKLFYFIRLAAILVIGITLLLIIGSILFVLSLGEKANVALLKAKNELEDRVIARTTELSNEKALLNSLINAIPDLVFYKDTNLKFIGANAAFEKQIGFGKEEFIGKMDSAFIPEELAEKFEKSDKLILNSSEAVSMESEDVDPEGNKIIFDTKKSPFFDEQGKLLGLIGISRDITERKKTELKIKSRSAALKSAANGVVITSADGEIAWVNPAFMKLTGYSWDELVGNNPRILSSGKHDKAFFDEMWKTLKAGNTWHGEIINKKKNNELYNEEMTITPIINENDEIVQFVAIKQDITIRKELELQLEIANKRMSNELNVAKNIQMSMLPLTFPAYPKRKDIDIYADLIPAREVGGDFYDFFFIDDDHICFVVGDVSGKGVPGALMMAVCKTLLKARAGDDASTASVLTHVNDVMAKENNNYMFVTVFMAILNTTTGELTYTNAGHNPTFIKRKNGNLEKLTTLHGPVIAAMEGLTYKESNDKLHEGDFIFLYTDGIPEAHNVARELYSDQKLYNLLEKNNFISPKNIIKKVIDSVNLFEKDVEQFDDITALCIEFYGSGDSLNKTKLVIIKNTIKDIQIAIQSFESFAEQVKLPMAISMKINIVFDELLANIVNYAFKDSNEHQIEIEFKISNNKLIIIISDDGIPFNPFQKDAPNTTLSIDEREIGGLGIHIVKNLVDEYDYQRKINKNIITLIKYDVFTNS